MLGVLATLLGGNVLMTAARYGASLDRPDDWLSVAVGVGLLVWSAIHVIPLQLGGGPALRVGATALGHQDPHRQLTDQLSDLEEALPSHVSGPLLERARKLEAYARRDPDGQAAVELRTLIDELNASADQEAVAEARALREELRRAQQALRETGGSS